MKQMWNKGWPPLVAILILIGLWELATHLFSIEEWLLPSPTNIIVEAKDVLPTFQPHFMATLTLASSGFLIGTTFGLYVATCLHILPRARRIFYPFLILSQNMPIIVDRKSTRLNSSHVASSYAG